MPAKPLWYNRIDQIILELQALPGPWVDRRTVEDLLGVGSRRAQQIMAPCIAATIGNASVAGRDSLVAHLERLASGDDAEYERRRRQRFAETYARLRDERLNQPQVLVPAPPSIERLRFADLPLGVEVAAGRITVTFTEPNEALEKLLALAMAIGNDREHFEEMVAV